MTVVLERCVDNINTRIAYADFISMRTAHKVFPLSKTIHLNQITKKGDYVTPTKFDGNLEVRMKAYHDSHKAYPAAIWTVKAPITPVPVKKPALILELESVLGGVINNIEDWIGLLIAHGVYDHYNCMKYMTFATIQKYGIKLTISRIRTGGLNCADYVALTVQVLEALATMGVKYIYEVEHVHCNSSNGEVGTAGHFLLHVVINGVTKDVDPAEAVGGKRGIGHNMCYYNYQKAGIMGHTLC
jgi:hypothetical protein